MPGSAGLVIGSRATVGPSKDTGLLKQEKLDESFGVNDGMNVLGAVCALGFE